VHSSCTSYPAPTSCQLSTTTPWSSSAASSCGRGETEPSSATSCCPYDKCCGFAKKKQVSGATECESQLGYIPQVVPLVWQRNVKHPVSWCKLSRAGLGPKWNEKFSGGGSSPLPLTLKKSIYLPTYLLHSPCKEYNPSIWKKNPIKSAILENRSNYLPN
jgi:hypothetical protein